MHPVIRITIFVVIAVLLARAHLMQMGWVLCVIGLGFLLQKGRGFLAGVRLLWRIRWLLLSILFVYVWLPIGSITESLNLAAHRIGLLTIMMFALQSIVLNMSRDEIVLGLYFVLLPVSVFGLSREKIVLRLILTMECIAQLPNVIASLPPVMDKRISRFKKMTEQLMTAFDKVLLHSNTAAHDAISIETDTAIPLWQWTLPLFVLIVFYLLPVQA